MIRTNSYGDSRTTNFYPGYDVETGTFIGTNSLSTSPQHRPGKSRDTMVIKILCVAGIFAAGIIFFSILRRERGRDPFVDVPKSEEDIYKKFDNSMSNQLELGGHDLRPKYLGFVGVQTGFWSAGRRAALRSTWFPSSEDGHLRLQKETNLAIRFVIGKSKDAKKMAELDKELEIYDDFMLIDVEEEFFRLPHKSLAFFKTAVEVYEADYYVKVDDDIYLRPDRLSTLLAKGRTHPLTYIGCMKKGQVIGDPKHKWHEKYGHLIGKEYFLHAYGPIYVLSAEVVASLANARNNSLRMFSREDVTIGSWMLGTNVHHEDDRALCDPSCTPTSIAVWDIPKCSGLCNPVTRMKELHKMSMCSN